MFVINIENPASPLEVARIDIDNAMETQVVGAYLYIAAGTDGVRVFNISDPENPFATGHYDSRAFSAEKIRVDGDHAYVPGGPLGLFVLDVSDTTRPIPAGIGRGKVALERNDDIVFDIHGDVAFLVNYGGIATTISLENQVSPVEYGTFAVLRSVVKGISTSGFRTILAHPQGLVVLGQVALPNSRRAMVSGLSWPYAFVAGNSSEFFVVDVSDPANPRVLSQPGSVYPLSLAVAPNFIVASGISSTKLIDVGNPSIPTVIGNYTGALQPVDYEDGLIYARQNGLVILMHNHDLRADVNGDYRMTLTDAIIALQCLSGTAASESIRSDYASSGQDINGDNQVGIEETIYIIQTLSELGK